MAIDYEEQRRKREQDAVLRAQKKAAEAQREAADAQRRVAEEEGYEQNRKTLKRVERKAEDAFTAEYEEFLQKAESRDLALFKICAPFKILEIPEYKVGEYFTGTPLDIGEQDAIKPENIFYPDGQDDYPFSIASQTMADDESRAVYVKSFSVVKPLLKEIQRDDRLLEGDLDFCPMVAKATVKELNAAYDEDQPFEHLLEVSQEGCTLYANRKEVGDLLRENTYPDKELTLNTFPVSHYILAKNKEEVRAIAKAIDSGMETKLSYANSVSRTLTRLPQKRKSLNIAVICIGLAISLLFLLAGMFWGIVLAIAFNLANIFIVRKIANFVLNLKINSKLKDRVRLAKEGNPNE